MSNTAMYSNYVKCPLCLQSQDPFFAEKETNRCTDRKRCALQLLSTVECHLKLNPYGAHPNYALAEIRKEVRNG